MRINIDTVIEGRRVILVPYREEHVLVYHQWMTHPELREATASEPLTLDDEYEMQSSWANDEDKCTFILLDKDYPDTPGTGTHGGAMCGDVNLYFNDNDCDQTAEIEIMVAEERSRRKGIAREALIIFMAYAVMHLKVAKFRAKIGSLNTPSVSLFTSLGYQFISKSEVFQEITMELVADKNVFAQLMQSAAHAQQHKYDGILS